VYVDFRFKRHARLPADVSVFVAGAAVDRFIVGEQDFEVRRAVLQRNPSPWEPLRLSFLSRSSDPRPLGVALDWVSVRPSRAPLLPEPRGLLQLVAVVLALYAVPRFLGFSALPSLGLALGCASALALWAALDKLGPLHAVLQLGSRLHWFGIGLVLFFRWRKTREGSPFARGDARWAILAAYLGTTARLLALFHPEFYYPDVRTHSKFVSLIWTEGLSGFFSHHIENQHRLLLGLQLVGDQWLAFPYPPLLYLTVYPLSLLELPVDDWMKLVPVVFLGIEALVVYSTACRLGASARGAAAAAWIHSLAPVLAFRLTVASYAALYSHFWDLLLASFIVSRFARMDARSGVGVALLVAASILSHAGGALALGTFVPAFALAAALGAAPGDRGRALRLAAWALAGALLAVGSFYWQYVPELLPGVSGVATGAPLVELRFTPLEALGMAWHRLTLFYSGFGMIAAVGALAVRGRFTHPLAGPLTAGVGFGFLGLNVLRSGLGETHIFQFTKDDLLVLPWVSIVIGELWAAGSERWPRRRLVVSSMLALWMAWGAWALFRDVRLRFVRPGYDSGASVTTVSLKDTATRSSGFR
jgi:hypothetical protein